MATRLTNPCHSPENYLSKSLHCGMARVYFLAPNLPPALLLKGGEFSQSPLKKRDLGGSEFDGEGEKTRPSLPLTRFVVWGILE